MKHTAILRKVLSNVRDPYINFRKKLYVVNISLFFFKSLNSVQF